MLVNDAPQVCFVRAERDSYAHFRDCTLIHQCAVAPVLDAKAGETYYVRVDIQIGFFKGHGGVTLVDPQQGKYEVPQAAHQGADDQ